MTYLLKDPGATLSYSVDWGADYLAGDTLASSEWNIEPGEPGGVAVMSDVHDGTVASVSVSGGIAGHLYRLVNRVATSGGQQDRRSILVRVEAR